MKDKNNLGCGEEFGMRTNSGFICGVANGNGAEYFCKECKQKMKFKWAEEDRKMWEKRENYLNDKGGNK